MNYLTVKFEGRFHMVSRRISMGLCLYSFINFHFFLSLIPTPSHRSLGSHPNKLLAPTSQSWYLISSGMGWGQGTIKAFICSFFIETYLVLPLYHTPFIHYVRILSSFYYYNTHSTDDKLMFREIKIVYELHKMEKPEINFYSSIATIILLPSAFTL